MKKKNQQLLATLSPAQLQSLLDLIIPAQTAILAFESKLIELIPEYRTIQKDSYNDSILTEILLHKTNIRTALLRKTAQQTLL